MSRAGAPYTAPASVAAGRSSGGAATEAVDRLLNAYDAALRGVSALARFHAEVAAIPGAQRYVNSAPTSLQRALQAQVDAYTAAWTELETLLVRQLRLLHLADGDADARQSRR